MKTLVCECGKCHRCKNREYMRARRATDPEAMRTAYRAWHEAKGSNYHRNRHRIYRVLHLEEQRSRDRDRVKKRTPRDPAKKQAGDLVMRALKSGQLVRQPCEVCGESPIGIDGRSLVHAHHDDYDAPLEVRWLCSVHHGELHRAHD